MPDLDARAPRLGELVPADEPLAKIAGGFLFTEGPVWHPVEGHLTFSDIPASTTLRWDADLGLRVLRHPSNKTNGNAYDGQGRLISCEHATSRLVRIEADATITVLADRYDDKELNSPNDVVVSHDGTIYFTDPLYGRTDDAVGVVRDAQLAVRGVYRLDEPTRELTLLIDDCEAPNGLCLSLDERYLFVNDSERGHIRRFELDGRRATVGDVWAEPTGPGDGAVDGMKIDSQGNLYCTGPGGVFVYDPRGTCLGVILVPERVANLAWGDDDLRTLYLCASTSLYACRVTVPGVPAF